jgi:dipeptidyl aminopeptidase/acylaminoacyl peptidase
VKKNGGTVEYLLYEDEGHGLAKLKNRLDAYPKIAAFLDEHLETRCGNSSSGTRRRRTRR